jgi:hypothetical protein
VNELPQKLLISVVEGYLTYNPWFDYLDRLVEAWLDTALAKDIPSERKLLLLLMVQDNDIISFPIPMLDWVMDLPIENTHQLIPGIKPVDGDLKKCPKAIHFDFCKHCEALGALADRPDFGELSLASQLQLLEVSPGHDEETVTRVVAAVAKAAHSDEEYEQLLPAALQAYKFGYCGEGVLAQLLGKPVLQQLPRGVVEQLLVGVLESEIEDGNGWVTEAEAEVMSCVLSVLPAARDLSPHSLLRLMKLASRGYSGESWSSRLEALWDAKLPAAAGVEPQQLVHLVMGAAAAGASGVAYQLLEMLLLLLVEIGEGLDLPLLHQLAPVMVGFRCKGGYQVVGPGGHDVDVEEDVVQEEEQPVQEEGEGEEERVATQQEDGDVEEDQEGGEREDAATQEEGVEGERDGEEEGSENRAALGCIVCALLDCCCHQLPPATLTSMFITAALAAETKRAIAEEAGVVGPASQHQDEQQQQLPHLEGFRGLAFELEQRLEPSEYVGVVFEVLLGLVGAGQVLRSSRKYWLQQLMKPCGIFKVAGRLSPEQQLQLLMAALDDRW